MKCWKKLSASETIYRKTLINAISAENAMREFGISEEVMSTNISQKILFDKLNRDDLRPMPYVKIDHTEVSNTPGITTVDVYQPLTPHPYARYYFLIEVYDFHNIMFDRREFVNFYKIENQLDWIVNVIAEATENILSSIASMNYSLNNNQIRNNQRDDELIRLLNNLQEAVEINIKNRDAELTIINIIKKNINLQKNIDAFSSLLTKTMDEYLIPELEKLGDNVTDDAVKKLAKLLKLKKNTFEDDELYNEFFKVVEDIFTNLSNNAKELSFVVEHKRNIIPKKYNQENVLQYDEGIEKQRKKIVIKEENFIARFSKLTNQRNARGKRVTLDTVNSYWRILTHFHKLQGRG
jgi:hypothetical protein